MIDSVLVFQGTGSFSSLVYSMTNCSDAVNPDNNRSMAGICQWEICSEIFSALSVHLSY